MGKLVYAAITSLDGYIEDDDGRFDFAVPDPEVHAFVNEVERSIGTHIYGRRMYQTMAVWQTIGDDPDTPAEERDYAELWRGLDKVVVSRTLSDVVTPRTKLFSSFDADAVRALCDAADHDVSISGPTLAAHAFRAGLVDEVHQFAFPLLVGGGKSAWPSHVRLDLELVDQRRFASGVVYTHHRVRGDR